MNYKNIGINLFRNRQVNPMTAVAIISGIAVGAAIGALFATSKGRECKAKMIDFTNNLFKRSNKDPKTTANAKLGNIVTDVRSHVKRNAEGLVGRRNTEIKALTS